MTISKTLGVLLPAYNCEEYIGEAIESVLKQTYSDFECHIIDDGSTDGTAEVIKAFGDERIKYHKNPENLGIVGTLNRGIDLSETKYLVRMDADDICREDRFEKLVAYMEANPEVGVCGSNLKTFGNEEREWIYPENDPEIKAAVFFRSLMGHPTVIIRREVLKDNNLYYSDRFPHMEDADLWFKLFHLTKFHNLQEILFYYRLEGQNITVRNRDTQIERERKFFGHLFKTIGLELVDEELSAFVKRRNEKFLSKKDVIRILKVLEKIKLFNRSAKMVDDRPLFRMVKNEQDRLFFKACDSGFSKAMAYMVRRPKLHPADLYYLIRTAFRRW